VIEEQEEEADKRKEAMTMMIIRMDKVVGFFACAQEAASTQAAGRVEAFACPPSSKRACDFPAHGFPMFFMPRHAPSSSPPS